MLQFIVIKYFYLVVSMKQNMLNQQYNILSYIRSKYKVESIFYNVTDVVADKNFACASSSRL